MLGNLGIVFLERPVVAGDVGKTFIHAIFFNLMSVAPDYTKKPLGQHAIRFIIRWKNNRVGA